MSISDFFSSIFGKTYKRNRPRGKKNIKTRQNKKRRVRFMKGVMKGGWGGADPTPSTQQVPVMKGGWGGALPAV